MFNSSRLIKTAVHCRQALTAQQITPEAPGSVLKDIQTLIGSIGTQGLRTQSNRGNLPSSLLSELNGRLSQPIDLPLKRPLLRDYPNIAGLYVLLRVMEMVRAEGSKLWIDAGRLAEWSALNPAEQYFALIEAWLFDADGDVLGGEEQRGVDGFTSTLQFLADLRSERWETFQEWVHNPGWGGAGVSAWNVQLMMRLGLIEALARPLKKRSQYGSGSRGWMMWKAKATPWGEAVTWALLDRWLCKEKSDDGLLMWISEDEGPDPAELQSVFRPYFPEYLRLFHAPEPEVQRGVYVFKVGFRERYGPTDVWRQIAAPDSSSLYDLAHAILKAFNFEDDEHLHQFQYRDRLGRTQSYLHPYAEEEPFSDEVTLGETQLPVGGTIHFKFDFGASWRFVLRLERIDASDRGLRKPKVIGSAGVAPKQYEDEGDAF